MQAIVCELCGGNQLIKDNGYFVCQHCGTKYTLEEAKKIMLSGTVKIDNSGSLNNFLVMSRNAYASKNYTEAMDYSNKVLEIESNNSEAWYIKGSSAGWLSNPASLDLNESIQCWGNSIAYAPDDVAENCKKMVFNEYTGIIRSLVNMNLSKLAETLNTGYVDNLLNMSAIIHTMPANLKKMNIPYVIKDFYNQIAATIMNSLHETAENADRSLRMCLGRGSTIEVSNFISFLDSCIEVFEMAAGLSSIDMTVAKCFDYSIYYQKRIIRSITLKSDIVARKRVLNETARKKAETINEVRRTGNNAP